MVVRNDLLIHPLVGIELACLEDMQKTTRSVETAVGKLMHRLHLAVFFKIEHRARIQHCAGDTLFGQNLCGHSACMSRPDDQDVNLLLCHAVSVLPSLTEMF